MPALKISHIVSFSSEDPSFPAENLCRSETYKKWKCKTPGEKQASAILQLEKASFINSVDIGNESSAFVEILVGRSGAATDEFQVLLVASSFMSPMESRNGAPANRVRMFSAEQLSKPALSEKWDQVKVVCTQPFNRNIQYGLSFLTIHSPEAQEEGAKQTTLGKFIVKEGDEDEMPVGRLFVKRKEFQEPELTGAAAIRKASQPTSDTTAESKLKTINKREQFQSPQSCSTPVDKRSIQVKVNKDSHKELDKHKYRKQDADIKKVTKPSSSKETYESNLKTESLKRSSSIEKQRKKLKTLHTTKYKPFKKLLDGVVFVLSGYQNPHRAILRKKALEMGAKYEQDWGRGCTHLICAFPNTPKFQRVKGKGCIVHDEWITKCHAKRKRLPWRRFALDPADKDKEESEEEIIEDTSSPVLQGSDNQPEVRIDDRGYDSGSGTDEDIERVKQQSLRELEAQKAEKKKELGVEEEDPYGGDTDIDSDNEVRKDSRPDTSNMPFPHLPDFYKDKAFYIHPELESQVKDCLVRYIIAFSGNVVTQLDCVDYVLAEAGVDLNKVKAENPQCMAVTPEWVWKCNDEEKFLPTSPYEIKC